MPNSTISIEYVNHSASNTLEAALFLLDRGWASTDDIRRASDWRNQHTPRIGKLAMNSGKLSVSQVFDVLSQQAITGGLFGQVAVVMGLLNRGDIYDLLEQQAMLTPSLVDSLVELEVLSPQQAAECSDAARGSPAAHV